MALIGIDTSGAFDNVNHVILLDRLRMEFGIDGAAQHWTASYLSDRTFFICVGESLSPLFLSISASHKSQLLDNSCLPCTLHQLDVSLTASVLASTSTLLTRKCTQPCWIRQALR